MAAKHLAQGACGGAAGHTVDIYLLLWVLLAGGLLWLGRRSLLGAAGEERHEEMR